MSGPQSQLDELGSIRGLITDATKDTALWLQANPSAEGRVHVLAIQERLANLARIIERRLERRSSPNDGGQWSENVAEVLSLLGKAGEVRGHIVGNGLARMLARLPQELPSPKRPRVEVPPPVKPVNTSKGIWLGPPAAQRHYEREVAADDRACHRRRGTRPVEVGGTQSVLLLQTKATDRWAYHQAKDIRQRSYELFPR